MKQKNFLARTPVLVIGALICCALWGGAFPAIKVGYQMFGIASDDTGAQIIFAGCRFILAGFLAQLIGSLIYGEILYPKLKNLKMVLVLALLQTTAQYFFFYIGLAHTTGVKASIVEALNVFVALLIAALLFQQEKLTVRKILGCILGFTGVVIVNLSGSGFDFDMTFLGEGCIFLSTIAYAFSSVCIKKYSQYERPFTLSAFQFMIGGLLLILVGIGVWDSKHMVGENADRKYVSSIFHAAQNQSHLFTKNAVFILFLLAGISAIAYSLWGLLLKYNEVSRVAVFGFLTPIFGVLFSTIFLQEESVSSTETIVTALALVSVGTLMVQWRNKKEED
ncbi:MAG: DMT family transporter [Lachnospiraceae bacterium]|nr:DMT family transporter [Lachnospiraceae bacterium]